MVKTEVRALATLLTALTIALLMGAIAAMLGCSQGRSSKEKVDATSQTPPKLENFPPTPAPKPVRPRVASQGDSAPHYAGGGTGTCINNQPCRGFGVRNEDGSVVCTCYGRDGGCGDGQRCDPMRLACVPEKLPPFGRAAAQ